MNYLLLNAQIGCLVPAVCGIGIALLSFAFFGSVTHYKLNRIWDLALLYMQLCVIKKNI